MGQRHKHADVIIAWAEGKELQVWDEDAKCWCDVKEAPSFMCDKYRIKPSAKKYRVVLLRKYDEELIATVSNDQKTADTFESLPNFVRWLTDWVEYEE